MKKILIIAVVAIFMVSLYITGCSAVEGISVKIDGKKVEFDVQPQNINGRVLVPMRKIGEALNCTVAWDDATKTATFVKGDRTINVTIGSNIAKINGQDVSLDVAATIIDGRTLVPVRFVSESMGVLVSWDGSTQTVIITTNAAEQQFYAEYPTVPSFGYVTGLVGTKNTLKNGIAISYEIGTLADGKLNEYKQLLIKNGFEYVGTSNNRENYKKDKVNVSLLVAGDPIKLMIFITNL